MAVVANNYVVKESIIKLQEKPNYVCTCVKHCRVTFFVCYIYLFFFLILKQTIKCKFQMHVREFALTLIFFFFLMQLLILASLVSVAQMSLDILHS